jgi:predicted nucleotidyltransferase
MFVPPHIIDEVSRCLPKRSEAVMIFGSAARGDMVSNSDIDVLVITRGKTGTTRSGRINISSYSQNHLQKMAVDGSLFVRHLIMDGKVLNDNSGILAACLGGYVKPLSYAPFRSALRSAMPLFDVDHSTFSLHAQSYMDVAVYCLRTALYVKADEQNILTFSLRNLESLTRWPEIKLLNSIKHLHQAATWSNFKAVVAALESELGMVAKNPASTLEAYVTNNFDVYPLVLSLSLRILSGGNVPLNYDLLSPLSLVS